MGTSDPESVKSVTLKGHLRVDLCGFLFVCFSSFVCAHFYDKENELVRKRGSGRERMTGEFREPPPAGRRLLLVEASGPDSPLLVSTAVFFPATTKQKLVFAFSKAKEKHQKHLTFPY